MILAALLLSAAGALSAAPAAPPEGRCASWKPAVQVGSLDPAFLSEASGLAVSKGLERLYHINDSGDAPYLYFTDLKGGRTGKTLIEGFQPLDTEGLSLGPCESGTCLYVGDIGDNFALREEIAVALIPEERVFKDTVRPLKTLRLAYPDGPHNSEALAVHPSGDLFLVTKEKAKKKSTRPARFFRLSRDKILSSGGEALQLEPWGSLDVPSINKDKDKFGRIVTSLDISPDGRRFALLTYANALEVAHDLSSGPLPADAAFSRVPLQPLVQQEAAAYSRDGRSLLYTSELAPSRRKGDTSPELMRVDCGK